MNTHSLMPSISSLESFSLRLLQNKQNSLVDWSRTYRMFKRTQGASNVLRPRAMAPSTRQTDQTSGPFAPTRAPQTRTQTTSYISGINSSQILNSKMLCWVIKSPSTLFLFIYVFYLHVQIRQLRSPCRARCSLLNGGSKKQKKKEKEKKNPVLNTEFLQQDLSGSKKKKKKKEGNVLSRNRPESSQKVCGELNFHFQMENISCFKTLHKGTFASSGETKHSPFKVCHLA